MSIADQVYHYTARKIAHLQSIQDSGSGRGMLAELRRGVGKAPGELPELWGMLFDRIPEELTGKNGASPAEWAVYTALTLFALHQQGNAKQMHQEGVSIGSAAARLVEREEDTQRILNRLHLVATAVSPEDLAYHLRGIITLLRGKEISLDYAKLAKELYLFHYEETGNAIRLHWGRDFYRDLNRMKHQNTEEENDHDAE